MAATLKIISSKVGVGGQRQGVEVRRILQLLSRAGYLKSPASLVIWTDAAIEACKAFHSSIGHGLAEVFDPHALGDPLLTLCKEAKVVLPLASNRSARRPFSRFGLLPSSAACLMAGAGARAVERIASDTD